MLRVNLKSVYAVVHYAAPQMIAQRGGRIIAISSVAGAARSPLSHALRRIKRRDHQLCEGPFDRTRSPQYSGELRRSGMGRDRNVRARSANQEGGKGGESHPAPARGEPDEIAGPILFAASDLATFITGEVINVNGGSVLCG